MPPRYRIVLITAPEEKTAAKLAKLLLAARLAACVSRMPVASSYRWEGKIENAKEVLLLVKTRASLASKIINLVSKNHPHRVPEILSLPLSRGFKPYLEWIGANTR